MKESRVFESNDTSPETIAANKEYFESQGAEVEVEGADTVEETQAQTEQPKVEAHAQTPGQEVDAETETEWNGLGNDGKKRGSWGRLKQDKRKAEADLAKEKERSQQLEAEVAKLRKPAEVAPAQSAEKATTFSESEPQPPAEPQESDFANADDPIAELRKAVIKYTKDHSAYDREHAKWERKKETFESEQNTAKATREQEQQQQQTQEQQRVQAKLDGVKQVHADFEDVLKDKPLTNPMKAAALVVDGGLETLYALAKDHPDKLKEFTEATGETNKVNGQDVPTQAAYNKALFLMGRYQTELGSGKSTPSSPPPVEERASAAPVRGRQTSTARLEDLTGDARRDARRALENR